MNFLKNTVSLIVMVFMAMFAIETVAQNVNPSNLTSSPYTRYGYGKIGSVGNASTRGMGDLGIALRTNNYTTLANPASLTAIDTLTMIFSAGLDADYSTFTEGDVKSREWHGGFSYMSMHFPLWRNFAMSLSLTPYTEVGYSYGSVDKTPVISPVDRHDTLSIGTIYSGAGGINNFMMGVGYRAFQTKMDELNVGVNFGYLFGTLRYNIDLATSSQANSTSVQYDIAIRGLLFKLGAQYTHRFNATRSLTVGATFQPKLNMNVDTEELKVSTDTIYSTDEFRNNIKSPMKMGLGLTYNIARQLTVSAEYEFTKWSEVSGINTDLSEGTGLDLFDDTHRIAVGAEYIPRPNSNKFWQNCRYRAGFNTKNSYMQVNTVKLRENTFNVGLSMPVNRRCFIDFSAGYSSLRPSKDNMFKEDYLVFSLGVTFNEMMFFRNRLR